MVGLNMHTHTHTHRGGHTMARWNRDTEYFGLARRKLTFFVKLRFALLFFLKPHSQNAFGCSGSSARGSKLLVLTCG